MDSTGWASRGALVAVLAWTTACGGAGNPDPTECATGAMGLAAPPCTCTSWTNVVFPSPISSGVLLEPDLSTSPARATVRVGQAFRVASGVESTLPADCNQGWSSQPTWTASDPSVLRLEATAPGSYSTATFRAIAPGVSMVFAGDLVTPSGQVDRVGLTACAQAVTTGFTSRCTQRVPLEILVVP